MVRCLAIHGQVVAAEDHVLGRTYDRLATGRLEQVAGREHQLPGLSHGLARQGHVHGHLVAVKVGVEGSTHQGVDLDGLAVYEAGLKGLDTQAVQGRRTVQQNRPLLDDLLQDLPDLGALLFNDSFRALDIDGIVVLDEAVDHKGLEQLQRHALGQAALVQFQVGTDDDHRPPGIVHTLAEQVAAEAALLALQVIRQRLERAPAAGRHRLASPAVVDQRVDRFLKHALLVADDDIGRAEIQQPFEPVVAVDHPPIQVVQVRGRKPATVQLNHGPQLGRDDRQDREDHPFGAVAALPQHLDDPQSLRRLLLHLF